MTITIGCLDELDVDKDDFDCYIEKKWNNFTLTMTFPMPRRQLYFCQPLGKEPMNCYGTC